MKKFFIKKFSKLYLLEEKQYLLFIQGRQIDSSSSHPSCWLHCGDYNSWLHCMAEELHQTASFPRQYSKQVNLNYKRGNSKERKGRCGTKEKGVEYKKEKNGGHFPAFHSACLVVEDVYEKK
ncbi:hypothetical protein AVEN_120389-1 [Araneus ventricosus]|uniref:Uncharacterized protein n=1 Tax=Araneus ventricosus TaxID=182803 RepID=A0A4Y2MD37_ARAVE|nr:hypothetical protein AVEN_120389-1 [Araneus ventricosus]